MTKNQVQENQYVNREVSWLQFNARVLQEANDETVPLIERLRFLGIFSNNLDEFFKVRYATIKRIVHLGKNAKSELGGTKAKELLDTITDTVINLQNESLDILDNILSKLEKENIYVIDETQIEEYHHDFLMDYFQKKVSPELVTIILSDTVNIPNLKGSAAYLAVRMVMHNEDRQFALIEIPKNANRFIILPKYGDKNYIIMLDDLLRYFLKDIFNIFDCKTVTATMIKITRDAELGFDGDLSKSFIEKLTESIKSRKIGEPVRFVYDKNIHPETLKYLMSKMGIGYTDSIIPGGRYHNRRDYMGFPSLGRTDLLYDKIEPLPIKGLNLRDSIFKAIAKKDYLLYAPYQTFSYVVKFLREAALDPKVKSIKITIYRLAEVSQIASALINAAINGKSVTATIELRARFDEKANIDYAEQMQNEGVNVIFGVSGLKVHSKICVIEREEGSKITRYGFISTGNFNESTAKIYTDHTLFTADQNILNDAHKVFNFFETNYKVYRYKHLILSPHYTKPVVFNLIENEIEKVKSGQTGLIRLKMNSISSFPMINKLYEASKAGVKIEMIVRGICCLVPGIKGVSENIEVISVVDKFLEHSRIYIFGCDEDAKVYISSADWMTRNIENRVEVSCPIYDDEIKKEVIDGFNLSWNDNVKARLVNSAEENKYKKDTNPKLRSQFAIYDYYSQKLDN